MPRRSPHSLRAEVPGPRRGGAISTLLVGACPGPPWCADVHTYLFVDGLDLMARSHHGAAGLRPGQLLRPGGPLHPADAARQVRVASLDPSDPGAGGLDIRLGLRGGTVVWSDLMYPGFDGRVVVEARFHLGAVPGGDRAGARRTRQNHRDFRCRF